MKNVTKIDVSNWPVNKVEEYMERVIRTHYSSSTYNKKRWDLLEYIANALSGLTFY